MPGRRPTKAQLSEMLDALRQENEALRARLERAARPVPDGAATAPAGADQAVAERYRSVVETVVDGVIIIDAAGTIESMNPAAETIFGYAAAECVGRDVAMLMPEPARSRHRAYVRRYLETGERRVIGQRREVEGLRRDGSPVWLELAVSEFRLGSRRMFTGIVRDVSARKHLERQLVQAQKMESIGQVAGGIAHDFNNQLGIILFDVDLLLAGTQEDTELREDLLKIRKVVLRSASLARQLLLFGRRQRIEPCPTDLNQHVHELRGMLGRLLGERIALTFDLADDLWQVNADPGTIDQVILNLAINSRDAMPDGGVLRLATRNVELDESACRQHSQARPGRFACLQVIDSGVGMSEEVRLRIFEPFFTTKEEGKGSGLGLSVVYGIVQAHGGWIDVASRPGGGSTFSVFLAALGPAGGREPRR